MLRFLTATIILLLFAVPNLAFCDDNKQEAKRRFETGNALLTEDDFETATVEFELSVKLYPTKGALFNLANCYKGTKRYGKSLEAYKRLEKDFGKNLSNVMRAKMEKDVKDILILIATLKLFIDKDGATVTMNGKVIGISPLKEPLKIRPGKHNITVSLDGYKLNATSISLIAGEKKELNINLSVLEATPAPAPVPAPFPTPINDPAQNSNESMQPVPIEKSGSGLRTTGGVFIGIGSALLGGAIVTGIMAKRLNSSLNDDCPNGCYDDYYDDLDKRDTLAITTDILLGVGGAVVVTGIVLLIAGASKGKEKVADKKEGSPGDPEVSFLPTIGGFTLMRRF